MPTMALVPFACIAISKHKDETPKSHLHLEDKPST